MFRIGIVILGHVFFAVAVCDVSFPQWNTPTLQVLVGGAVWSAQLTILGLLCRSTRSAILLRAILTAICSMAVWSEVVLNTYLAGRTVWLPNAVVFGFVCLAVVTATQWILFPSQVFKSVPSRGDDQPTRQYGVRHLLMLMAAVAVTTSVARVSIVIPTTINWSTIAIWDHVILYFGMAGVLLALPSVEIVHDALIGNLRRWRWPLTLAVGGAVCLQLTDTFAWVLEYVGGFVIPFLLIHFVTLWALRNELITSGAKTPDAGRPWAASQS